MQVVLDIVVAVLEVFGLKEFRIGNSVEAVLDLAVVAVVVATAAAAAAEINPAAAVEVVIFTLIC